MISVNALFFNIYLDFHSTVVSSGSMRDSLRGLSILLLIFASLSGMYVATLITMYVRHNC